MERCANPLERECVWFGGCGDVADVEESYTGQFLRHVLPEAAVAAA